MDHFAGAIGDREFGGDARVVISAAHFRDLAEAPDGGVGNEGLADLVRESREIEPLAVLEIFRERDTDVGATGALGFHLKIVDARQIGRADPQVRAFRAGVVQFGSVVAVEDGGRGGGRRGQGDGCAGGGEEERAAVHRKDFTARNGWTGAIGQIYDGLEAMPATVRLQDIVDALEMQFDESPSFLDLDTGQVETISSDLLSEAEESGGEEPDLPEGEDEEWQIAKRIVSTDRYRKLPTNFDVHEWQIMQDFSYKVESESIRDDLLFAIHGAGAFRTFKHTLRRHGIEQAWFAFRADALKQIALEWCEEHKIVWE